MRQTIIDTKQGTDYYNEVEKSLEYLWGKKVVRLSKESYKSIKKNKKYLESAYNIKIKKIR